MKDTDTRTQNTYISQTTPKGFGISPMTMSGMILPNISLTDCRCLEHRPASSGLSNGARGQRGLNVSAARIDVTAITDGVVVVGGRYEGP